MSSPTAARAEGQRGGRNGLLQSALGGHARGTQLSASRRIVGGRTRAHRHSTRGTHFDDPRGSARASSGPTRVESPAGIRARSTRRALLFPRTLDHDGGGGRARRAPLAHVPTFGSRRRHAARNLRRRGCGHSSLRGAATRGGHSVAPETNSAKGDDARAAARRAERTLGTRGDPLERRRDRHARSRSRARACGRRAATRRL